MKALKGYERMRIFASQLITFLFLLGIGTNVFATTLLYDDFEDGNNDGWTTTVGSWDVQSGVNRNTGLFNYKGDPGGYAYTYAGDPLWADYLYSVDVTFGTNVTEFYVGVRADINSVTNDPVGGNQYLVSLSAHDNRTRLRYYIGETWENIQITSFTFNEQQTYNVKVLMVGNHITSWIDDALFFDYVFSGSDPIYSNGVIGLGYKSNEGVDGAYFDNVLVSSVQPVPEPSSLLLLLTGISGIGYVRFRKKK